MHSRALARIHDGQRDYFPGDVLSLGAEDAAVLLRVGYVELVEGEAETPPPDRVNLNSASHAELVALPRIGERAAKRLIAARPLESLEAARLATGISADRWADIAHLVEV